MNPEDGFSLQEISSDTKLTDETDNSDTAEGDGTTHEPAPQIQSSGAVPSHPGFYPIRRRGLGVVLCNISFSHPLRQRRAAAADRDNLCLLFGRMGLKVSAHTDMTGSQLRELILHYSKFDHGCCDCFFLAVSTHGDKGMLLGTDGECVSIDSCLLSRFNGANCPSLRGKPKVFFLQACRGGEKDFCVDIPGNATDAPGNGHGAEKGSGLMELIRRLFPSSAPADPQLLPGELDFFICYSTVPGYVSWRSSVRGSWFLFALYECYLAYGNDVHLAELMTYVTDYVTRCFYDVDAETHRVAKQVICCESRLSKFLKVPLNST